MGLNGDLKEDILTLPVGKGGDCELSHETELKFSREKIQWTSICNGSQQLWEFRGPQILQMI